MVRRSRQLYADPLTDYMTGYVDHLILGAATYQTDYQVMLSVYRGYGANTGSVVYIPPSECRSDFSDIRVVDEFGLILPHFVETPSGNHANIWIKISTIPTTGVVVRLLFGGGAIASGSVGSSAFPTFFDDFQGSVPDSTKWATLKGTWEGVSVSNSICTCLADSTDTHGIISQSALGTGIAIRSRLCPYHPSSQSYVEMLYPRYIDTQNYLRANYSHVDSSYVAKYEYRLANTPAGPAISGIPVSATWFVQEVKLGSSSATWTIDDANEVTFSLEYVTTSGKVGLGAYGASGRIDTDWIFARKYVSPEPAHGWWGSLEDL